MKMLKLQIDMISLKQAGEMPGRGYERSCTDFGARWHRNLCNRRSASVS